MASLSTIDSSMEMGFGLRVSGKNVLDTAIENLPRSVLRVSSKRPLTATSCLHGLRGIAASVVVLHHLLLSFWEFPIHGSTQEETDPIKQAFRQFPVLRLVYSGHAMVAIFFVISGYLDSIKPLKYIHEKEMALLQGHLASSVLRRGPRLFLPAIGAAVLIAFAVWLGLYEWNLQYRLTFFEGLGPQLKRHDNILAQLNELWSSVCDLLNVWTFQTVMPAVNIHFWTLACDLRATYIRYLAILCTSRLRVGGRILMFIAFIFYCGSWGRWEVVLNLCGALLCQVDLLTGWLKKANRQMATSGMKLGERRTRWICIVLFVLSLYLCLLPEENGRETPGFRLLSRLTPKSWQDFRYWNSWASVMLVWAVLHHNRLSRFLEGPIPQYLGNISFSMYLLHGPILHMTAYALVPMLWSRQTFGTGTLGKVGGFLVPALFVVAPSVVLVSDIFTRTVESRLYSFIQRFERILTEPSDDKEALPR